MRKLFTGLFSLILSYLLVYLLVVPTLQNYPRLYWMANRSEYTDKLLWLFIFLSLWLFYWQWEQKKFWNIYIFLFYSGYFVILFIMLFTKAQTYHAFNLNPFNISLNSRRQLAEFVLNICYFVPLGCLYGIYTKLFEAVIIALVTILGIEIIQYIYYLGVFDILDILANVLGCLIGYYLYLFIRKQLF